MTKTFGSTDSKVPLGVSETSLVSVNSPGATPEKRGEWGGKAEFILTCIGYAVGLGSVWRFPYLCYRNGGGSFVVPYIFMLLFLGIPIFFFELCIGQFSSRGPTAVWAINPLFKGLGYGMVGVNWLIGLYYNVIIAWCFFYFFKSMTSVLPWTSCGNSWNTDYCMEGSNLTDLMKNTTQLEEELRARGLNNTDDFKNPSEEYFYNEVIQLSSGMSDTGTVVWPLALCLLLAWVVVFLVLLKGIQSLGKVMYFVTIFPYILMTAFLVQNCLLPGAREGIIFYITPDWTKLKEASVWSDAATQLFFTLSSCSGGLIAMASYNQFRNNCLRDAILVPIVTVCTSFFAGFVVFSALGFMAHAKGLTDPAEFDRVVQGGPGLVFIVYPEAISQMSGSTVWAILFFFMMILLGFSSELSIAESVFVAISDEFPDLLRKTKKRGIIFRGVACCVYFLISLPMVTKGGYYLFNLIDNQVSGFPLLLVGFFELTSVNWIYGYNRFLDDIEMMLGKRLPQLGFFMVCWLVFSPLILLGLVVFKALQYKDPILNNVAYPAWGLGLGWAIVVFTLIWIPVVMVYRVKKDGSFKKAITPLDTWGPANEENRTGRYKTATEPTGVAVIGYNTDKVSPSGAINKAFDKEADVETNNDKQNGTYTSHM